MAGSVEGGKKAAQVNKLKYGSDYYANIGRIGGKASNNGGFYGDSERARKMGRLGGAKSSRRGVPQTPETREKISESNKRYHAQRKKLVWLPDNEPFESGFNKLTIKDRVLSKLRRTT